MISKISNHWSLMIFQISDISEIQDLEYGVCNFMHLYIYFHHVMTITNLDIIVFQSRKRLYNRKCLFVHSSVCYQNPSTA